MKEIDFSKITGASYAGNPENDTIMYITKKVEYLVENLKSHTGCIVFIDEDIEVPADIQNNHMFFRTANPQLAYARCADKIWKKQLDSDQERGYSLTDEGYYVGKNIHIGENVRIEPGVLIGHDVVIGDHSLIMSGSIIKHTVTGHHFLCNENAVIGAYSFTMAEDESGNKFRIPTLGNVRIGNNVEIGAFDNVAAGACGDTILEDYVKLDALVHIGHEAHLHKNVEITAGVVIGGFTEIGEHGYMGVNSAVKNRRILGGNCLIGMGAVVVNNVSEGVTVVGNPARVL